ncbi:LysR family transcriptional regulator [Arthrobacter sp. Helios]|uniref:LysR family transcriptional regulator n=1 Tax=Arthrobacter sp. Helios TaxID=2828862 RepID=UPI002056E98C|nr:LysR family transcriptional regulator [Arthrobacter sp. Helios]UPO76488.1 LysR family transcriptional regulator [Arthrobacter sp. Helios]
MVKFTLKQIQYFVAVADHGSISAAATASHISQAAMSQALSDLERVVGAQLVVRHRSRGVVLTGVGQQFLADVRGLVRHAGEVQNSIIERQQGLVGPLAIGCYSTLAAFWVPVISERFIKPNPRLNVTMEEGEAVQLQHRMQEGSLDAVLTHTRHLLPGVQARTVKVGRPYVLLAAGHPLASRKSIRLAELATEDFVSLDIPSVRDNQLVNLRLSGLDPKIAWRSSSFEAVRGMVARGLGYTVLVQRPPVNTSYDGLPLATVEIDGPVGHSDICVAYASVTRPSLRLRAFLDFCSETGAAGDSAGSPVAGQARS